MTSTYPLFYLSVHNVFTYLNYLRIKECHCLAYPMFFASIVVGKLTYCMSVWGGFLKESHVNQINSVFRKGKRYGYTETMYDIKGLLYHFDSTLFNQIRANEEHCLNHILPLIQNGDKILRSRGHGYPLPICLVGSFRESFIPRCLYSFL